MKICIITNTYSADLIGGSNVYTENLSLELENRNNEVIIIAASPIKKTLIEKINAIKIYRFYPLNISTFYTIGRESILKQAIWTLLDIYSFYSYRKILTILQKENPDVVHLHMPIDVTLSAFAAVKKLKLPLVLTVHDYLMLCRRIVLLHGSGKICAHSNVNPLCKLYRFFTRKISTGKPNIVIFPSEFILNVFRNNKFFEYSKKVVLPYGIELNNKCINTSYRKNNDTFTILYVGSLTKHKGIDVLIKAFSQINNKNVLLSIVGEGIYKNTLKHLIKDDKRIIFHGKVNNSNIEKFYNSADVLVVPSIWHEVLGIVIQEAFRAGIPVIGSNIGGIPEIVRDNYNGFLFQAGNEKQLKQILENCIEKPAMLKELGMNAREFVKKYEMSIHINRLIHYYEEAIHMQKSLSQNNT